MKPLLMLAAACMVCLLPPPGAFAEPDNPATDWFMKAKYGAFMHFLPDPAKGAELTDAFDTGSLANQLSDMGVGYFVLTLGQNSGWLNSPNAEYDRVTGYKPGEMCSTRDLPLDLYQVLQPKGIRLMLYLPCQTPNRDARAQRAFGLPEGPQDQPVDAAFAEKWARVIQEWSDRYGDRIAGWWFDGGYEHIHFNEEIAGIYAAAVKHGSPQAIVTFNPGVRVIHYTDAEDYTAGELNDPFENIPENRWLNGSQWHALTFIGSHWGARDTRFTSQQWIEWARKVFSHQGVITFDMGPNYDPAFGPIGALAADQVEQLKALRQSLE